MYLIQPGGVEPHSTHWRCFFDGGVILGQVPGRVVLIDHNDAHGPVGVLRTRRLCSGVLQDDLDVEGLGACFVVNERERLQW